MTGESERVDRKELIRALAGGTLVLTGNARLSRALRSEYDRHMLTSGHEAWPTPALMPWKTWLQSAFEEAALSDTATAQPRLLDSEQEALLWAGIIAAGDNALLRVHATAARAAASWALACEWELDPDDPRFNDNENTLAFRRWARRFERECADRGCISAARLPAALSAAFSSGRLAPPGRILLTGFYELTPAQRRLVTVLEASGSEVHWRESSGCTAAVRRVEAQDSRQEMQLAARWARALLRDDPDSLIGVVVPGLGEQREALASIFRQVLEPAALLPGGAPGPGCWNISLGRPLAAYPMVRDALALLGMAQGPLRMEDLGPLLLSPYWAGPREPADWQAERNRRALLDRRLRRSGDAAVTLGTVRYHAGTGADEDLPPWASPGLAERLDAMAALAGEIPVRTGAGEWARWFAGWLTVCGWPGERGLDSAEYQLMEAWHRLLSRLSSLENFAGSLDFASALALLRRLAGQMEFQPQAPDAPVQVLGLYEANGQAFDHLWVMGLHDAAWPPAPAPDPYLPAALQRELGMPRSSPDWERRQALELTALLAAAAPDVVFSHPCRNGEEELQLSPLIERFAQVDAAELPLSQEDWAAAIRASAAVESVPAATALPLVQGIAPGGASVIRNQAACPFRAYAESRLGAKPLDGVQPGLGAMRRGSLLHRVLEALWRELGDQAALLALDAGEQDGLLRTTIAAALEQERRGSFLTLTPRYTALEGERLRQQVEAWLDIERQRAPFTVVGLEQNETIEVAGVGLTLQIDRLDLLADGRLVVIDYKTGAVAPSGWFGERPDDPQLPLYAMACRGQPLAAVAFARLAADTMGFQGVVSEPGILPGLPAARKSVVSQASENWPAVLDDWAGVIERLAVAFCSGTAEIDPKRGRQTCGNSYCELTALCRVNEATPAPREAEAP